MNKQIFDLDNTTAYQEWRDQKINQHPSSIGELLVEVRNPRHLSDSEHQAILDLCAEYGYKVETTAKDSSAQNGPVEQGNRRNVK